MFLKEKIMQLSGLNKEKVYAEVSLSVYFPRKTIQKGEQSTEFKWAGLPGTALPTGHLPLTVASTAFKWVIKSLKSKQRQDVNYVNFYHLYGSERHQRRN